MSDPATDLEDVLAEVPRLLTLKEVASTTGLSHKAILGRVDRGTLRSIKDPAGVRRVPRAELERAGLLTPGYPGEVGDEAPSTSLVKWEDLYERERREREQLAERERQLYGQLQAIANAGPIRALRLRRQLRTSQAGLSGGPDLGAES